MPIKQVSQIAEYGLAIVLAVLAAVLLYRGLVSGRLRQLVAGPQSGRPSPARLQALAATLAFAAYYVTEGLKALSTGDAKLPDIPPEALTALGASLGVHLGGKIYERPRGADGDGAKPPPPKPPRPKSQNRKPRGKTKP